VKRPHYTNNPIRGRPGIVVGNLSMGGSSLKPTQTSSVLGFYFLGSKSPADPEHVAIRMAEVHLADVPRHIGIRERVTCMFTREGRGGYAWDLQPQ